MHQGNGEGNGRHKVPLCLGTGLLALDVVLNGNPETPPRLWAGGSCGNVMSVLAFLGWKAVPLGRLGRDEAATRLIEDLRHWNVSTQGILLSSSCRTPVIIHRIQSGGKKEPTHRFEWNCPTCGTALPRYKPFLTNDLERVEYPEDIEVFYCDRVTPSSARLAKRMKESGALLFFEPSGIKNERLFLEILEITDILKYPHSKTEAMRRFSDRVGVPLEIETRGAEGLEYRLANEEWSSLPAVPVLDFKDAGGSGDWCSAGIISFLGRPKVNALESLSRSEVESALGYGQLLGALNCYFEGARGAMYALEQGFLRELLLQSFEKGRFSVERLMDADRVPHTEMISSACISCTC